MPETDDGKVTLALLGQKLDNLKELMIGQVEDTKEWRKEYSERLRKVEDCNIKLQQYQSTATKLLIGFSMLLSAIAAYIGSVI